MCLPVEIWLKRDGAVPGVFVGLGVLDDNEFEDEVDGVTEEAGLLPAAESVLEEAAVAAVCGL